MKRSLVTSAVIHCLVLIGALVTLGAPAPLETQPESEAMPVDLVSADQLQQGEKTAPVQNTASKKPTTKQSVVANAQNAGENDVDLKTPVVPTQRPADDNAALSPKKSQVPVPQNDPRPNDVKTIEQKDTEAAPKEVAAIPQQKPDVTPTPTPQKTDPTPTPQKADPTPQKTEATPVPTPTPTPTPEKADPQPQTQPTEQADQPAPDKVPVPDVKPQPTPQKTADAKPDVKPDPKPDPKPDVKPVAKPDVKPVTKPATQTADAKSDTKPTDKTTTQSTSKNTSSDDGKKDSDKKRDTAKGSNVGLDDGLADQINNVLNNTSSKGGAKRSSQSASAGANNDVASLGGKKSLGGGKLSASEMDGLKSLIQGNWNVVNGLDGASDVRVKVTMQLDRSGNIVGMPVAQATGGPDGTRSAIQSSAIRAVMRSAPFNKILPPEKYDGDSGWNQVVINFDASDLGL